MPQKLALLGGTPVAKLIRAQNARLTGALAALQDLPVAPPDALGPGPLAQAHQQTADAYDPVWGGFGSAPKFPHPGTLERLLRAYAASVAAGTGGSSPRRLALVPLTTTSKRSPIRSP